MPSKQRYMVIGVITLGVLVGLVLSQALRWLWLEAGWHNVAVLGMRELPLTSLLGYSAALGMAAGVLKYGPTRRLSLEVVDELVKVDWPTRTETGYATGVVVITVVVCATYLGFFDAFWLWMTHIILGLR